MSAVPPLIRKRDRSALRKPAPPRPRISVTSNYRILSCEKLAELSDLTLLVRQNLLELPSLDAVTASCTLRVHEQAIRTNSVRRFGAWHCDWGSLQLLYRSLQDGLSLLPAPAAEPLQQSLFILRRTIGRQ